MVICLSVSAGLKARTVIVHNLWPIVIIISLFWKHRTGQCHKILKKTVCEHKTCSNGRKGRDGTYNCPYNKK